MIKEQIVASTIKDSQDEKLTKQDLDKLMINSNNIGRFRLGKDHDLEKKSMGYLENFKVKPHKEIAGEFVLVADVYYSNDKPEEISGGFSWSINELFPQYKGKNIMAVFLPYPYYNSEEFINEIEFPNKEIGIGKWRKKSADLVTIGLVVSYAAILLAPEWDITYKSYVRPFLKKIIQKQNIFKKKNITFDYLQPVTHPSKYQFEVVFIHTNKVLVEPFRYSYGMAEVNNFIQQNLKNTTSRKINRIRMIYKSDIGGYKIWMIEYKDGNDEFLIDH